MDNMTMIERMGQRDGQAAARGDWAFVREQTRYLHRFLDAREDERSELQVAYDNAYRASAARTRQYGF